MARIHPYEGMGGRYDRSQHAIDLLWDGRDWFWRGNIGHGGGVSSRCVRSSGFFRAGPLGTLGQVQGRLWNAERVDLLLDTQ
jgi:hypothetical protein